MKRRTIRGNEPVCDDAPQNGHGDSQEDKTPRQTAAGTTRRRFLGGVGAGLAAGLTAGRVKAEPLAGAPAAVSTPGAMDLAGDNAGTVRADKAYEVRTQTALTQRLQPLTDHLTNGDEDRYPSRIGNFSKGMPHNELGEVDRVAYNVYLQALSGANFQDFERIPMGGNGLLTSPMAGIAFEMIGGDLASFYQPPAPAFSSAEIAAEIAENYWMALARDIGFHEYETHPLTILASQDMSKFSDFRGPRFIPTTTRGAGTTPVPQGMDGSTDPGAYTMATQNGDEVLNLTGINSPLPVAPVRRRLAGPVTPSALFRGVAPGDMVGPYVSQFLFRDVPYGPETISRRVKVPIAADDYLTTFSDWLFAQMNTGQRPIANKYDATRRYIRNARDLGEWAHIDVFSQAFTNAALILLGLRAPVDVGNPYVGSRSQMGFATFGPPHLFSILSAVSGCALRAVWYQKWYVHRRLRPEEFGARIHNHLARRAQYPLHPEILNSAAPQEVFRKFGTYLLPMAYPEGSPTHPAYGSGHSVIAGACVTILKAWFNESWVMPDPVVATPDGLNLTPWTGASLTLGGELNKLASNVALGRNMGGVHWRSDATESLRMGEDVAISFLSDMKTCNREQFSGFSLTKFDGQRIVI